jgi:hypothetical protein
MPLFSNEYKNIHLNQLFAKKKKAPIWGFCGVKR